MSMLKGWFGEKTTQVAMWIRLDGQIYQRFHDVIVPSRNGTTQIDHLLISPYGIFVIETKNYKGWIFGSEDQAKWTQVNFGKKNSFQNPLRQNYRHIKCLSDYLGLGTEYMHSIVFFIGECTFKTPMPSNVLCEGLSDYIKGFYDVVLNLDQIERYMEKIQYLKDNPGYTKREHLESLRARHNSTTVCPKCGGVLKERTAKNGPNAGSKFLGCSNWPKCKFTKSITF